MNTHTILSGQHVFTNTRHAVSLLLRSLSFGMTPLLASPLGFAAVIALFLNPVGRRLLLSGLTLALQLCALFALLHHSPEISLTRLASLLQQFQHVVANLVVESVQLFRGRRVVWF